MKHDNHCERNSEACGCALRLELLKALQKCHDRLRWRGEGPNEGFERIAANFQRDTGLLAPGKDARHGPSYEERVTAFDQWLLLGADAVHVALRKAKGEA